MCEDQCEWSFLRFCKTFVGFATNLWDKGLPYEWEKKEITNLTDANYRQEMDLRVLHEKNLKSEEK